MSKLPIAALLLLSTVLFIPEPVLGQSIIVSLNASAGTVSADEHRFGVHDDALVLADPYDLPEPPLSPNTGLSLAFVMAGYSGPFDNRWREEFRPTELMEDETEVWLLHIDTDQVGQTALLAFAAVMGSELPLAVVISAGPGRASRGSLPVEFFLPLDAAHMEIEVTLIWDDPVGSSHSTWGGVKSLFLR